MLCYVFLLGIIALSIFLLGETIHEFHEIRDHPDRFPRFFHH